MSAQFPTAHGPHLDSAAPSIYHAMNQVAQKLQDLVVERGLDPQLLELAFVRASQLNGCAACLSVHGPKAREAGIPQEKLDLLPAWREGTAFSDKEKATLELTEHLTKLPAGTRHSDAVVRAGEFFSEDELVALEWGIIVINAFNRISIASGHDPIPQS